MSLIGSKKAKPITRVQFETILKKFIQYLKTQLRLKHDIPIMLVDDVGFARKVEAFGEISSKNIIHISIANRHPMDVLRTVAHEYVHYKQHVEGGIRGKSSHAGSQIENQANAKAGELMRKYGNLHPELFDFSSIG